MWATDTYATPVKVGETVRVWACRPSSTAADLADSVLVLVTEVGVKEGREGLRCLGSICGDNEDLTDRSTYCAQPAPLAAPLEQGLLASRECIRVRCRNGMGARSAAGR